MGTPGVTPWAGKSEWLWPGQAAGRLCLHGEALSAGNTASADRGPEEPLHSVRLEMVGGRPGDAFLVVFSSPFSELCRLYMKKDWWQKHAFLLEFP